MWSRWIIPLGLALAQAVAIYFSRTAGQGTPELTRSVWALATLAFLSPAFGAWAARSGRLENFRKDAQITLLKNLPRIAAALAVKPEEIGMSAFLVRRRWPKFWAKHQERQARVRLRPGPPSGTRWSRGKGVIGRLWEQPGVVQVWPPDPAILKQHKNDLPEEWEMAPDDLRMGLSHQEWQALRRYDGVVAIALNKNPDHVPRYRGCVTLEFLKADTYAAVNPEAMEEAQSILSRAAETLAADLP